MYVKTISNIISAVTICQVQNTPCLSLPPLGVRCHQCAGTFLGFQQGEELVAEVPARGQPGSIPEFTFDFLTVKGRSG